MFLLLFGKRRKLTKLYFDFVKSIFNIKSRISNGMTVNKNITIAFASLENNKDANCSISIPEKHRNTNRENT